MEGPEAKSGNFERGIQNYSCAWRWRHRTWRTVILSLGCILALTGTSLPQASADLTNETAILLGIKQAWGNPTALGTWSPQFNTCSEWVYVTCDARNSTIINLLFTDEAADVRAPLPTSIGGLVNLELLYMANWGLTGEIPSSIGLLKNLTGLNLSRNVLNGSIPSAIGNLTNLQSLTLSNNNLAGSLPESLSQLRNLNYLYLDSNHLSGSLPNWIGDFPVLLSLFLGNNYFTGTIPPSLGNLTTLLQLSLTSCWASAPGPLPAELGNLTSLTDLVLNLNPFEGSIPPSFGNLIALETVDLSSCSLSGAILPSLGNLSDLSSITFSSNSFAGPIPDELGNARSLTYLALDQNLLSGTIPPQLSQLSNLTYLDLHSNRLGGSIPTQLSELSNLNYLDLSSNSLSGEIPAKVVTLPDLETLYLEDNCLSGPIPSYNKSNLVGANFGETSNSNCFNATQACKCGGAPSPQPLLNPPATAGGGSGLSKNEDIYIGLGVGLGGLVAILGLLFLFCWRHNRQQKFVNPTSLYRGPVRQYTVPQVKGATSGFSTKVGEGAYATVYRAVFEDGTIAAVKRFNKRKPEESFEKEVELLSSLNHRFLVNLVGYCEDLDEGEHMLLYEFMDRGNLHENLHGRGDSPPISYLTWAERVRVIISVGYGIEYLHFGTSPPLIHRDIKSSNILLSSSGSTLIAKLADFGLGKQTVVDADVMTATFGSEPPKAFATRVAGTPGYVDPEYVHTSVLSDKTDVFSYGVVLLELLTGRRPVMEERLTLANWAKPYLVNEDIWSILDPQLELGTFEEDQVRAVAELARRCTENDSRNRPTMKDVAALLSAVFTAESRMVNASLRTASSMGFSESTSTVDSQSRVLTSGVAPANSMNYTQSEILPRD